MKNQFSILFLLLSISFVFGQSISVDISDVTILNSQTLNVSLSVHGLVENEQIILGVNLLSNNEFISLQAMANINADSTELQNILVNVGTYVDLLDEVIVKVNVIDIISLDINISGESSFVDDFIGGVITDLTSTSIFGNVLNNIFSPSTVDASIAILDSQELDDGEIRVSLQLLNSLIESLPVELNVEIMLGNEILILDSQVATFLGEEGEIIDIFLDLSAEELSNLDISEIDLSVQVSLSILNLVDLHLENGVSVEGLDELLNDIIDSIENVQSSNIEVELPNIIAMSDISLDENTLSVTLELDGNIGSIVNLNVNVNAYSKIGELLNLSQLVSFDGLDGETIIVDFDLSTEMNDIAIIIISLSDLQVNANVNIALGNSEIISIVDGTVNELLGNLLNDL